MITPAPNQIFSLFDSFNSVSIGANIAEITRPDFVRLPVNPGFSRHRFSFHANFVFGGLNPISARFLVDSKLAGYCRGMKVFSSQQPIYAAVGFPTYNVVGYLYPQTAQKVLVSRVSFVNSQPDNRSFSIAPFNRGTLPKTGIVFETVSGELDELRGSISITNISGISGMSVDLSLFCFSDNG